MIQSAIQYHANETALSANSFTTRIVQERILFVAKSFSPTVEIYFTNPLRDLIDDGVFLVDFVSENHIYSVEKKKSSAINKIGMSDLSGAECWIIERFNSFSPSILVLVRYSGPHSELLVRLARARRIPIIYHIDDDLLNVPVNAGLEKQNFHNKPERLSVVRSLLKTSTLVFCSTKALMNQIMALEDSAPATTTQITCALNVQSGVRSGPVRKIGYMGGADHVNDFSTIVGALVLLLRKHTQITFEFFGGMQIPERLKEFGDRVKHIHPSINYEKFLARFSACEWDIGLCPLDKVYFNLMKTPIKWFDYTSIGAAVVATRGTVYDDVCAGNCGGLAGSEMEWFDVLDDLINNPSVRYLMAANAQNKLKQNYSVGSYKNEILNLFNQAHQLLQDHSPHKAAV
jgi:glycosyltransferase involved in cell wall biosynthesis